MTSKTFHKLKMHYEPFPKELEQQAVENIRQLRVEQNLINDATHYNWSNIIRHPELVELFQKSERERFHQTTTIQDSYHLIEWPYAERSFNCFAKDNQFRKFFIRLHENPDFKHLMVIVGLVNIIAFCIYDYSVRIHNGWPLINRISVVLEIICNIIYGLDIVFIAIAQGLIFEGGTYLRKFQNIINLLAFICTWGILAPEDSQELVIIQIMRNIRLLRTIRVVYDIHYLRTQLLAFIGSISHLGPILVPILFFLLYYAIVGLHLFSGVTEQRCRITIEPVGDKWIADPEIKNLCGVWQCPSDRYCGNPADYNIPRNYEENNSEEFYFGLSRFDDFFHSLFVTYLFLNVTGWSGTTYYVLLRFMKVLESYDNICYGIFFCQLDFHCVLISSLLFRAFILSNLLLGAFYESFIVQSTIKSNKGEMEEEVEMTKRRQQMMLDRLTLMKEDQRKGNLKLHIGLYFDDHDPVNPTNLTKIQKNSEIVQNSTIFKFVTTVFIVICSISIATDYQGQSKASTDMCYMIQFICSVIFFAELIVHFMAIGWRNYLNQAVNLMDSTVILVQVGLYFYLFLVGDPLIFNYDRYICLIKSLNIIRLLKLLHTTKIFYSVNILTRALIESVLNIVGITIFWLWFALLIALYGRELLAYRARFEEVDGENVVAEDYRFGEAPEIHFEDFGSALMAAFNIFYNEEWHVIMFQFARTTKLSIVFYAIFILLGQVLFIRLFCAIFLNQFTQKLAILELSIKPVDINHVWNKIKQELLDLMNFYRQKEPLVDEKKDPQPTLNYPRSSQQFIAIATDQAGQTIAANMVAIQEHSDIASHLEDEPSNGDIHHEPHAHHPNPSQPIHHPPLPSPFSGSRDNEHEKLHYKHKSLFIFEPSHKLRQFFILFVDTHVYNLVILSLVLIGSVRFALDNPFQDPFSTEAYQLQIVFDVLTAFYLLNILVSSIAFGFIEYLFRNAPWNMMNFCITVVDVILLITRSHNEFAQFLSTCRILNFISLGAHFSKDIYYAQMALINAVQKMITLTLFAFFIFMLYGIFAVKLLKGYLYHCTTLTTEIMEHVVTSRDCMDYGGSWVNSSFGFDNIFDSLLSLFIVATSEGWLSIVISAWTATGEGLQPVSNHNRWWDVYFQMFFFFGNLIVLNMFIGLIVNTYTAARLEAQNLHQLDENQREWYFIKESIYEMKPICKSIKPSNPLKQLFFFLVKNKKLKIFWLFIIMCNTIVLALYQHRQHDHFRQVLDTLNIIFIICFTIEITSRFIAKEWKIFIKDRSNIQEITLIWLVIANLFTRNNDDLDFQFRRCFNAVSVAIQMARNYRIIKRFNLLEKLFSSITAVLPSALAMILIMICFLFVYTCLGMNMYGYLMPQPKVDEFDVHFRKFSTAMFALVRVASIEQWFYLLSDCARTRQPDFACNYISSYEEYLQYGLTACGTQWAYLYYLTFHLLFSLVIMSLFIASLIETFFENAKSEKSAVSKFQLDEIVKLWSQYDKRGDGYVGWKDFWVLTTQFAMIIGVKQASMLKEGTKKDFLTVLSIPIYENKKNKLFCLRFHDVIVNLTLLSVTLKFGVTSLEPENKELRHKLHHQVAHEEFKNLNHQFVETRFTSAHLNLLQFMRKKIRMLKLKKQQSKVLTDLPDMQRLKQLINQEKQQSQN